MYKQIATFAIAATRALLARKRIGISKKLALFGIVILLAGVPFAQDSRAQVFTRSNLPKGVLARWGTGWLSTQAIAYSPDGLTLAVAGTLGIWLLDVHTDSLVALLPMDRGVDLLNDRDRGVLAFSPDGATLVSGDESGNVQLWDVASGAEKARLKHEAVVASVGFSPDGATLVSGDESGNVRLWDVASGAEKAIQYDFEENRCKGDNRDISVAFALDGAALATACRRLSTGFTLQLWYLSIGTVKTVAGYSSSSPVKTMFSPDGATFVFGSSFRSTGRFTTKYYSFLDFWDLASGEKKMSRQEEGGGVLVFSLSVFSRWKEVGYRLFSKMEFQIAWILLEK